jgi:hypothetical protein
MFITTLLICSYTVPDDEFNELETSRTLNINIMVYWNNIVVPNCCVFDGLREHKSLCTTTGHQFLWRKSWYS